MRILRFALKTADGSPQAITRLLLPTHAIPLAISTEIGQVFLYAQAQGQVGTDPWLAFSVAVGQPFPAVARDSARYMGMAKLAGATAHVYVQRDTAPVAAPRTSAAQNDRATATTDAGDEAPA